MKIIISLFSFFLTSYVWACSCMDLSLVGKMAGAKAAFVGTVVYQSVEGHQRNVDFRLDTPELQWKKILAVDQPSATGVWQPPMVTIGTAKAMSACGVANLIEGKEYLVFVDEKNGLYSGLDGTYFMNSCSGPVELTEETKEFLLVGKTPAAE